MDPLLWFGLLVILVGAWLFANQRLTADFLSPFNLLLISWIVPMYLRALGLSGLEEPWVPKTYLYLGATTAALVGTSILPWLFLNQTPIRARSDAFMWAMRVLRARGFLAIVIIGWLMALGASLYAEFLTNPVGIPLVAALKGDVTLVGAVHRWGKETRWAILINLFYIVTPILYMAGRSESHRTLRRALFLMAFTYPVLGLLKLSRSDLFVGGLNLALSEYYWVRFTGWRPGGRLRKKILIAALVVAALAMLYFTMSIRIAMTSYISPDQRYSKWIEYRLEGEGPLYELSAQVYGYLALPFENFNRFVAVHPGSFRPGLSFFRPLLSAAGMGDRADELSRGIDFNVASSGAGSNTFLSYLYAELGVWGVTVAPLIYGLLVNLLYIRFRRRPTFVSIFLYINFVYAWTWLYFNNAFSVLTFYLNAGFVVGVELVAYAIGFDLILPDDADPDGAGPSGRATA